MVTEHILLRICTGCFRTQRRCVHRVCSLVKCNCHVMCRCYYERSRQRKVILHGKGSGVASFLRVQGPWPSTANKRRSLAVCQPGKASMGRKRENIRISKTSFPTSWSYSACIVLVQVTALDTHAIEAYPKATSRPGKLDHMNCEENQFPILKRHTIPVSLYLEACKLLLCTHEYFVSVRFG